MANNPVGQTTHEFERHEAATRIPDYINPCWVGNLAVNQIVDELTDKPDIIDDRSLSPRRLVWQTGVDPAVLKRLRLDGNKSLAIGGSVDLCLLVVFPICRTQSMEIDHEGVYGIFTAGRRMHQILPGSGLMVDDNFVADTYGWR